MSAALERGSHAHDPDAKPPTEKPPRPTRRVEPRRRARHRARARPRSGSCRRSTVLAQLQVTTRLDGRDAVGAGRGLEPAGLGRGARAGDEVVVVGRVRRRFFRRRRRDRVAGRGRGRGRRPGRATGAGSQAALRRVDAALEALETLSARADVSAARSTGIRPRRGGTVALARADGALRARRRSEPRAGRRRIGPACAQD